MDLVRLNREFEDLDPQGRVDRLFEGFDRNRILVTSSFGSTWVILLHLLSKIDPKSIVHFVDTTTHIISMKRLLTSTRLNRYLG